MKEKNKQTLKSARAVVGLVSSENSKLECANFSFNTISCKKGMQLKDINNSICSLCYSSVIEKRWTNVRKSWDNNYKLYLKSKDLRDSWITNFLFLLDKAVIKTKNPNYFRWFPSGDIPSIDFLERMVTIANERPKIKFWAPTKQIDIVSEYIAFKPLPKNLNIRVSSYMINQRPPNLALGLTTSTVSNNLDNDYILCQATWKIDGENKGECGDCKMCWSKKVSNIDYKLH